ncbi:uncharacterized protein G2W53_035298 [Senna tora]|uniref:Uncharacterized protein n=1 Tax=Senna tora TaxID=362788 RepID=A0A834SQ41_9FABA|nr:uncharacterized protein G2W53_035298 [Senna tora]
MAARFEKLVAQDSSYSFGATCRTSLSLLFYTAYDTFSNF